MSECTACSVNDDSLISTPPANGTCPSTGYQKLDVCVPVTVTPFAKAQSTKTNCCGDTVIVSGVDVCKGTKNGTCTFTMRQTLCIEVPVAFGATAVVGDTYVDCLGASREDICKNCDQEEANA